MEAAQSPVDTVIEFTFIILVWGPKCSRRDRFLGVNAMKTIFYL